MPACLSAPATLSPAGPPPTITTGTSRSASTTLYRVRRLPEFGDLDLGHFQHRALL